MASAGSDGARDLNQLLASTLALLAQFLASLTSPHGLNLSELTPIDKPPNPLHVLRDSATLLKAHTTKLGLLAINKPFTPSAIAKVLRELAGTCLPAMISAVHICAQEKATWGGLLSGEVSTRVRRVFKEMETLLSELQSIANGGNSASKNRRDSLSSTGVVWESCDAIIELDRIGIAGLAVQKAEQYRDTIKDAINELGEWREGADLEAEGREDGLFDSDDEGVAGGDDRDSIEDIFNAANSMPHDRPELRQLVESAERTLKKVILLYNALLKRRIKSFKSETDSHAGSNAANVDALDKIVVHLRRIPFQVDELAMCFYDLDEEKAKGMLSKCVVEAKSASETAKLNWEQKEDEFTAWNRKWADMM